MSMHVFWNAPRRHFIAMGIVMTAACWGCSVSSSEEPSAQSATANKSEKKSSPSSNKSSNTKPVAAAKPVADTPRYSTREKHDPNGIGKFYMGREIAHVMGFRAAGWLERSEREAEERLSLLVKSLKLKPGMVVADIGAGSGVISIMMAPNIAPAGKVMAVDVQEEMLSLLRNKLKQLKIANVKPVLGTQRSPALKPQSVDIALMVDVYHEFRFPYEMMLEISRAIKPGGRVVFVEYRREDPKIRRMIKLVHTMTEAQVKKEMDRREFNLKWTETVGVLPRQHIIVFRKGPDAGSGVKPGPSKTKQPKTNQPETNSKQ